MEREKQFDAFGKNVEFDEITDRYESLALV